MYKIILFLFLSLSMICCALAEEVFQQTDNNGNIIYSDMPLSKNAKVLNYGSSNTTTNPSTANSTNSSSRTPEALSTNANNNLLLQSENADVHHKIFQIQSPKDQDTLYNQPTIFVDIKLDPELKKDEKLELLLDGKPTGVSFPSTHLQLENVARGTHQIAAELIKNNQTIQQTPAITVYVHKTSIQNILTSPGAGPNAF